MDLVKYNQHAWDYQVEIRNQWTVPVSGSDVSEARKGNWKVVLTPEKAVPPDWFPALEGLKILGLACGGGQQGPVLAAAGAKVTIFDNSPGQLLHDKKLSDQYGLDIQLVHGDMRDLSVFADQSFDLVFNPCSVLFVDNVRQVWQECHRVLRPDGLLMTGLVNPLLFQVDEESLKLLYKQPYSDLHSLPEDKLQQLKNKNEPLVFGHSLSDQIGGQLQAGFRITHLYEDDYGGQNKLDEFFPSFIATRAVKI